MRIVRGIFLVGLVILYGAIFVVQEKQSRVKEISLEFALPVKFQKIAFGYLRQLASEMLFIKATVFYGSLQPDTAPDSYANALGNNFEVMTSLYPRFIDPYYFCQSLLTPISPEAAAKASTVFKTGIAAYPNDLILRFFYGSNFFLSMNEPIKGAEAFFEAAKLQGAPPMFAHLAALLSAQGGDIAAGLISLKVMLAAEKDESLRIRYQQEVSIFTQAQEVQKSLEQYTQKYGVAANTLEELVPEFIESIPDIQDKFTLVYNPPILQLRRPDSEKK